MRFLHINDRRYAQLDRLGREPGLTHAFSTRPANVAPRNGQNGELYAAQRRTMASDLGLTPQQLRFCVQVHETRLAIVDETSPDGPLPGCDGVITASPGVPLMTFSADCPLVLVFDPIRRAVGMAHASWRCTVARLPYQLVHLMMQQYGCRSDDLVAGVGPGAGPCCYEVKEDVYAAAAELPDRDRFFVPRDGRTYFDLWAANQAQLIKAGVQPDHVEIAGTCTLCHNDVFYSYRREGKGCGHFGLMAALTES